MKDEMEETRMWEMSVDELRLTAQKMLKVADEKERQPSVADVLPVEIHGAVGEILRATDVTGLGRLASTNKFFHRLHRDRIEKMRAENERRATEYRSAFECLKMFALYLPNLLRKILKNKFENPEEDEQIYGWLYGWLRHLRKHGLNTWEQVGALLSTESPRRYVLVFHRNGERKTCKLGKTLERTLEIYVTCRDGVLESI